jgi:phosphoserine aminotransferase
MHLQAGFSNNRKCLEVPDNYSILFCMACLDQKLWLIGQNPYFSNQFKIIFWCLIQLKSSDIANPYCRIGFQDELTGQCGISGH